MAALTGPRNTPQLSTSVIPPLMALPQKGSTIIYPGALVALSAGLAVPASAAPGLKIIGRFEGRTASDSTGLADAALTVQVMRGVFKWDNASAGDAIAAGNLFKDAYATDDHTVANNDGGNGARSKVGRIVQIDSDGIWVESLGIADEGAQLVPMGAIDLVAIAAAGQVVGPVVMPRGGTIKGIFATVNKPVTTAAKRADLQPRITPAGGAAAAVTGGTVSVTSAAATPLGAVINGSAATAGNTFKAGDSIDIQALAGGFAAHAEGSINLFLVVGA